jgi:phosphoribosylglycinamide formyltransferase-1
MHGLLNLGVLISGTGTNLQAIMNAIDDGKLNAKICVVISNKAEAGGLIRAVDAGIPAVLIDHKKFSSREEFDKAVVNTLHVYHVEWIVLAGFMRIITPVLLEAYPMRVINIHPALLPSFKGVDAQEQALDYGVKITGCTVHFVDSGMDTGPIIAQTAVNVLPEDDIDSLRSRILTQEHKLLVDVLKAISEGRVKIVKSSPRDKVLIL